MKLRYLAAIVLTAAMMSSCSTSKGSLTYFEDINTSVINEYPQGDYSVKIVPDDELVISVTSMEPGATAIYNLPQINPATRSALMVHAARATDLSCRPAGKYRFSRARQDSCGGYDHTAAYG